MAAAGDSETAAGPAVERAAGVIDYSPPRDDFGPGEGWRLAWWVGVAWSAGIILWHGWRLLHTLAAGGVGNLELRLALWRWHQMLLVPAAVMLLVALLTKAPRRLLMIAALAATLVALLEAIPHGFLIRFWAGVAVGVVDSVRTLLLLGLNSAGAMILLWACLRPSAVTPRRLAVLAAAALIASAVIHAMGVASMLLMSQFAPEVIANLVDSHWMMTYMRAGLQIAAALLILVSLRAVPPRATALRWAGIIGVAALLGEQALQYTIGPYPWPAGWSDRVIVLSMTVGAAVAAGAPSAAVVLWPRREQR